MMNLDGEQYKRLVELAKQSFGGHGLINSQMPDQLTRQARAFAEEIVKQCSDLCTDNYYTPDGFGHTTADARCAKIILEHFGME